MSKDNQKTEVAEAVETVETAEAVETAETVETQQDSKDKKKSDAELAKEYKQQCDSKLKDYVEKSKVSKIKDTRIDKKQDNALDGIKSQNARNSAILLCRFFSPDGLNRDSFSTKDILNLIQQQTGIDLSAKYKADCPLRSGLYALTKNPFTMIEIVKGKEVKQLKKPSDDEVNSYIADGWEVVDTYGVSRLGHVDGRINLESGAYLRLPKNKRHFERYVNPENVRVKQACEFFVEKMK